MNKFWKKTWKVGAIAAVVVLIPTAAIAAIGTFTSTTVTPAVTGTNSATVAGAKGVQGSATATNTNTRYGVWGNASGSNGIGVQGTGTKYGVFSNGPLGVAAGKALSCTSCVGATALGTGSVTSAKLAAGSVGSSALAAGSVGSSALAAGSVGSSALAAGSVGSSALAAGSVDVGNLTDAAKQVQPLKKGESESGEFAASDFYPGIGSFVFTAVSLVRPVNGSLIYEFGPTTNCPGTGQAAMGYFCIYDGFTNGVSNDSAFSQTNPAYGAVLQFDEDGSGIAIVYGTYTVKAP